MCKVENDEDMKIVGEEMPVKPDEAVRWSVHKACGNIDRAHRLGAILAQQLITLQDDDPADELQQQMLFAFTMDTVGPMLLPDELLVQTARGTFFGRLRSLLPDFEDTMHRLGAFTFYRLCIDGYTAASLPAEKVGAVFAALCGEAENAEVEAKGAQLFCEYVERLKETVSMVDFQIV